MAIVFVLMQASGLEKSNYGKVCNAYVDWPLEELPSIFSEINRVLKPKGLPSFQSETKMTNHMAVA